MKRKLLSLILVAAMLASMLIFVPTASAAETVVTASLSDSAAVKVGETVEIDVVLKSDMPLYSYTLGLYYDATKLTLVEVVDNLGKGLVSDSMKNGPAYKEVLGNSPYDAFGWVQTDNTGRDISAGVAVATLVFTANEIGAAEVSLLDLQREDGFQFNEYVTTDKETFNGATALVDATTNVTVIPADYSAVLDTTDADWDFDSEYGTIYGILREDAMDFTGAIVIPSEIGGVAVAEIAASAFEGYMASTIVIPESVSYIALGAFYNCSNLTSAYIMNSNATIVGKAFGYAGQWRTPGSAMRNPTKITNDAGTASLITIYGASGSAVEAYATTDGLQFAASAGLNAISFADQSYLVGATATAPGTMMINGKTVVAWTDGTQKYLPGAEISLNGDIALEPVTITAPKTNTTADFKITAEEADLAMRFTSSMSKADYAALAELGDVKLGMLITPAAYVAKAGSFTKEALDALKATNGGYVDIAIDGYYKKTTTDYIFAGSLKGFSAKTLAKNPDFAAVLYATVTTDAGDVFTVYGDFNFDANQDVKTVATNLSTSTDKDLTDDQKKWLADLVGKFTPPAA